MRPSLPEAVEANLTQATESDRTGWLESRHSGTQEKKVKVTQVSFGHDNDRARKPAFALILSDQYVIKNWKIQRG